MPTFLPFFQLQFYRIASVLLNPWSQLDYSLPHLLLIKFQPFSEIDIPKMFSLPRSLFTFFYKNKTNYEISCNFELRSLSSTKHRHEKNLDEFQSSNSRIKTNLKKTSKKCSFLRSADIWPIPDESNLRSSKIGKNLDWKEEWVLARLFEFLH